MLDKQTKKYIDDSFKKIYKRFKIKELSGMNIGSSSTDFNEEMDGGGHATFKKEGKWHKVADYLRARLGLFTQQVDILEQAGVVGYSSYGVLWVLNNDPTELWFTDSDDNDMLIANVANNITEIDADDVNISDSGDIITATEVEAALQEIKVLVDTNTTLSGNNETGIGTNVTAIGLNTDHRGSSSDPHNTLSGGATTTFLIANGDTVTVTNGIITGVAP